MENSIKPLEWKKNPVYIGGIVNIVLALTTLALYYFNASQNIQITGMVILVLSVGFTFLMYYNQCPKCKRIFKVKQVSNEIIKKWEEPKDYVEKTIYYYSDGMTRKEIKNGQTKTFTARYEKHKNGYKCDACEETHFKIKDILTNRRDWERVTTPAKVVTSTKKPQEHYSNVNNDFSMGSFEPSYYQDKSGKRKTISKSVKMQLWKKYFGKGKAYGKCLVCKDKIHMMHFEAGHVKPASKGGSDDINNLLPICFGCNRSMGNENLHKYKDRYYKSRHR